jgi:KDO2-lipid IV(A) lauroyltransferase
MADSSSSAPRFERRFLGPRYWPLWCAVALLRALCWLPLSWLRMVGGGLGWLFGLLVPGRRRVVRTNLRLCFPEMSEDAVIRMMRAHFVALGAGLMETVAAWFASDRKFRRAGEVVGLEHLQAATADGSGVLLLTGHFTTLEIGARYLCLAGVKFHAMYRPLDNPLLDYWMHRWREERSGLPALPKDDLRAIVRALRKGRAIWYGPDQTLEAPNAIFVPFFGVPTLTLTATSRLAEMGRAKVVPFFPQRVGGLLGGRYRVVIKPALDNFPSGDDAADARRINALLEDAVRECPETYFWIHKRFKYQPKGMPNPYERRAA